jgi:hypothetical protein
MTEENKDTVILKNINKELVIGIPLSNQYPLLLPYPNNKDKTCKGFILGLLKSILPILLGFGLVICLILLISYYLK